MAGRSDYAGVTPGISGPATDGAGTDAGIDITGETGAAERFRQLTGAMAAVVQPV